MGDTSILTIWPQIRGSLLLDKLWVLLEPCASGMLFRPARPLFLILRLRQLYRGKNRSGGNDFKSTLHRNPSTQRISRKNQSATHTGLLMRARRRKHRSLPLLMTQMARSQRKVLRRSQVGRYIISSWRMVRGKKRRGLS